jgi:hypothetical protein
MRGRAIAFVVASLTLFGSGMVPDSAWGQNDPARVTPAGIDSSPIGKILTVTGSVTVEHASAVIVQASVPASAIGQAKVDDPVYRGDMIQTGADGTLGIVFTDGTSFNISKNARMELNEFVYDPNSQSNSTLFNLSKGTFTFVAGKVAKSGDMKVNTPVGTMGIRGTAPHVEILDDGTVKFSTLIEDHKKITDQAKPVPAVAPRQRRAQNTSPPSAAPQAEKDLNKKLNICRGC